MRVSVKGQVIYVKADVIYTGVVTEAHPSLELLFRALADPTRLRLLNLIADREICVCYFVGILRISQPKVSRHLAYLRRAGIVASRREGKWMHYRLVTPKDEAAAGILRETLKQLKNKREMRGDVSRLGSPSCTTERKPFRFQGNPVAGRSEIRNSSSRA